jgi:hypothetical protein
MALMPPANGMTSPGPTRFSTFTGSTC